MVGIEGPSGESADRLADTIQSWAAFPRRAVLFDFNGTLSDDEAVLQQIFTEIAADFRRVLTPDAYFEDLAGRSDREIIEIVSGGIAHDPELAARVLERRRTRYRELVDASSPVAPATVTLVKLLRAHEVPLGIVTGAERDDVEFVLDRIGLARAFDVVITAGDVNLGKPNPEGFRRAADVLGVDPSAVIVFEDSIPGITAARAAGMRCVAVEGSRPRRELEALADAVQSRLSPAPFEAELARHAEPKEMA